MVSGKATLQKPYYAPDVFFNRLERSKAATSKLFPLFVRN
jgi:hypothetical protein